MGYPGHMGGYPAHMGGVPGMMPGAHAMGAYGHMGGVPMQGGHQMGNNQMQASAPRSERTGLPDGGLAAQATRPRQDVHACCTFLPRADLRHAAPGLIR